MWPHKWLTPVIGFAHAAARPSLTPTPTSRQPTRPGPRVTAQRSMSAGWTAAFASARSSKCGSRSRWSRAASSGTTPPNSRCRSTCEWMTLLRTRRPPSTTATDVSSHDVSIPKVSVNQPLRPCGPPPHEWGGPYLLLRPAGHLPMNGERTLLGQQVTAQALDVGVDPVQVCLVRLAKTRRVDGVRPHHDGVLAGVRVVALSPPDDLEAEGLVHLHRVVVAGADLERDPLRAHVIRGLDQAGEDDAAVAVVLQVAAHADRRDVGLVVHPPHAAIADDRRVEVGDAIAGRPLDQSFLAQHDVMGAGARRQLAVVRVARPGCREDLALDFLDRVHVGLAHQLQRELLPYLNHLALRGEGLHVLDFETTIGHFAGRFEHHRGRRGEVPQLPDRHEAMARREQRGPCFGSDVADQRM